MMKMWQSDCVRANFRPCMYSVPTARRVVGVLLPLMLPVSVVVAYVAGGVSVMDFAMCCISLLGEQVWNAMRLLAAVPLIVALWQHRQRRRGRGCCPLLSGVVIWLVPMITITLLLYISGFWLACSTPFR